MPYQKKLGKKVRLAGIEEGCPTVVVENDYPAWDLFLVPPFAWIQCETRGQRSLSLHP